MARVVLAPHADGLGDNLLYSTLPRLYAERGDDVYISARPGCRNPQVRALVWEENPYVKGVGAGEPTVPEGFIGEGYLTTRVIRQVKHFCSPIRAAEEIHGFSPVGLYPEIYYKPKILPEWTDKIVCDPTSLSVQPTPREFDRFMRWCAQWYGLNLGEIVSVHSLHGASDGRLIANPQHSLRDIWEYCDIIASCKMFLCIHSGGAALASAILRDDAEKAVVLTDRQSHCSKCFTWPNLRFYI